MKRTTLILLILCLIISVFSVSASEMTEEKPTTKGSYTIPSYGAQAVWDKHAAGILLVVAHKGDWRNFPENSLLGINSCINMGVDIIEVDFNVTKDGVPVLLHDTNLRRMTDADTLVYIADTTWAQAKKYSLEDGQGNKGSNYILTAADAKVLNSIPTYVSTVGTAKSGGTMPIARFDSVLELVNKRVFLLMDKITTGDIFAYAYVCAREWDMLDYVIFKNSNTAEVMETWYTAAADLWNKKYPSNTTTAQEVKAGITYEYNSTNLTNIQAHLNSGVHLAFISVGITDSNEARIRDTVIPFCRKNGIAVRANTGEGLGDTAKTDSEIGWAEVLKIGVTEIMTDHPGELITYLQQVYGTRAAADRIEGEHFSDYNQDNFGFTVPLEYSSTRNKAVSNLTSKDTLIYENIIFDGTENTFTAKASAASGTITAFLDGTDATNKIGTLTLSGGEFTAPQVKISNVIPGKHTVYLKFTGTVSLDHIKFGRGLYFDFSTQAPLVYRYQSGPYAMTNYSTGNWYSRSATMSTAKLDNSAGTLSATLTAGGNHYIQTGTAATSRPLHYIPQRGDTLQIRMKIEGATANDASSNMYVGVVYSGTGCGDFDYNQRVVKQITSSQLNGEFFTLTMDMNSAFIGATEITALRLYFMNLVSASGKTATITVDHVYIGPKAHLPEQNYLYFDFTDTDADQMRYNTEPYSYNNFDNRYWLARTATMRGAWFNHGESALMARVTTGGNHYIQTGTTINERSLHYTPSADDYLQIVLRIDYGKLHNPTLPLSVGISYAGTLKDAFFYDAKLMQDFSPSVIDSGYFTVTVPMPDYFADENDVRALRLYFRNLAPKDGEAIITVDSVYLGPKASLPKPLYTVKFTDENGAVLESKEVASGDSVTYTGAIPAKAFDSKYHYTFAGWDHSLSDITADTTMVARYTATSHVYDYVPKEDTHVATCACGYSFTEKHIYDNTQCICGVVKIMEPMEDSSLKLGHTLNLASDISLNLAISKSLLEGFDMNTVYVESVIDIYDGNEKTGTKIIRITPVENGNYYYFTLEGLTAVQMNNRISSVLHGTKDGQEYYSPTDSYSIADYAYSQMGKTGIPSALKTLCADLLRYGACAQIFKNYRTNALATDLMTDAQNNYLSDIESIAFGNVNRIIGDPEAYPIRWQGKALNLQSKVCLKFIFSSEAYIGDISDFTLHVEYTDIFGSEKTAILTDTELYNAERGYYAFSLDSLLASELRTVIKVQIYAGETAVSPILEYSADTYGNHKTGALGDLCRALFAYSDSAKAYFLSTDP